MAKPHGSWSKMMETVLVTGGAGFIGAYVTRALLASGCRVVVYDMQISGNVLGMLLPAEAREGRQIAIESGEITDGWHLLALCRQHGVTSAVHLASPLTKDVTLNPMTGIRDICTGTATLFSVAREAKLRRVVWASSVAVFGSQSSYAPGPLPDDACQRPTTLYGSCKSLCENLARRALAEDGVDSVGLRLSVVYGAGRLRGYMSYPSHMLREAAAGTPVHLAYGPQRLHWQYVEEVAAMIATALLSDTPGEAHTFNGLGDSRTWHDAADAIRQVRPELRVTVGSETDPALADVVDDYDATVFSSRYAYRLGWPLERGIADTIEQYTRLAR